MNDGIIFDIDGTLWNACSASAEGFNKGLQELGISKKVTTKDVENIAGKPFEEAIEILLPSLAKNYPALLRRLGFYEQEAIREKGGVLYKNVVEGIKILSENFSIFIVSNCQKWYLDLFLQFSNMKKYLKDFDCYEMSQKTKYEMLINLKNRYSLNNPVYIGDTKWDQKAAKLAKINFIYVSYGFGQVKNKCLSFSSFYQLIEYFKKQT